MREQRRNAADRARLALDVIEREIAFGRCIKFEDARDREARLEFFPDVAAQAVAAGKPQPVLSFEFGNRRLQEIAAELADILEQRAVEADEIAPEILRRKLFGQRHRCARKQHAAGRDNAADGVIEGETIVKTVIGLGVGEACEPAAPVQDTAMADARSLGQAGRA